MKNYLVTIIGETFSEDMCEEIAISISPLVDSKNLKFQFKNGTLLLYFTSETLKSEIYEYINGVLFGIADLFVLTEITDNVSVCMANDTFRHLFDLENIGDDVDMRLDMNEILSNVGFEEDGDDDDIILTFLSQLNDSIKQPSLDQILDKINTKGYKNLTSFEKRTLENYSKN